MIADSWTLARWLDVVERCGELEVLADELRSAYLAAIRAETAEATAGAVALEPPSDDLLGNRPSGAPRRKKSRTKR